MKEREKTDEQPVVAAKEREKGGDVQYAKAPSTLWWLLPIALVIALVLASR